VLTGVGRRLTGHVESQVVCDVPLLQLRGICLETVASTQVSTSTLGLLVSCLTWMTNLT
jgi:hypothetical protein